MQTAEQQPQIVIEEEDYSLLIKVSSLRLKAKNDKQLKKATEYVSAAIEMAIGEYCKRNKAKFSLKKFFIERQDDDWEKNRHTIVCYLNKEEVLEEIK